MKIYLITNRKLAAGGDLLKVIGSAIEGGLDAVILREKDLPSQDLVIMARRINEVIAGRPVALIINNNLQAARAVRANGYHTGFYEFMQTKSRYEGLNGVSIHSLEEAMRAARNGASYLLASHIFTTDCKPGLEPKGVDLIKKIKKEVSIPVLALGGINPGNCRQVAAAGCDGVAVMSFIMQADRPGDAVRLLKASGD